MQTASTRETATAGGQEPIEPLRHIGALDGLRGVAVAVVLAYHGDVAWFGGGFLGVSMFFTLSGFLITSLLLREWAGGGSVDLRRFWSRRFRRLLPASWMTMAAVLALAMVGVWTASQLRSLRLDVPFAIAELFNWHLIAQGTSYGASVSAPSPLQHFWSLAVEQQFYVVLPLVVLGALTLANRGAGARLRNPLVAVGVVLGALALASAAANWHFARVSVDRAYLGTDTRAAEMLVGAVLAAATTRKLRVASARARRALAACAAVALTALVILVHTATVSATWLYPWGLLLTAAATATVVLAASQEGLLAAGLSVAPLVGLGRISYGVYLIHWPVFLWLTPARTGLDGWLLLAVRLTITLGAAWVSFRMLERPVRLGSLFSTRTVGRVLPAAAVCLVVTALLVSASAPAQPAWQRASDERPIEVVEPPSPPTSIAESPSPDPPTTVPGRVPAPQPTTTSPPAVPASRVLFVGDSIARSLQDDFGDVLGSLGVAFAGASSPGCGLVTGFPTDEEGRVAQMTSACDAAIPRRQLEGVSAASPDLVVAMSSWEMTNRQVDGTWYPFGTPGFDAVMTGLYGEAVDRLASGGARVALVLLPDVVEGAEQPVGAQEVERNRHLNALLEAVAAADPRVLTVDLSSRVCPADPCPQVVDGLELRALDGRHFDDPAASRRVAEWLAADVMALDLAP